jgi:hypothetical protein
VVAEAAERVGSEPPPPPAAPTGEHPAETDDAAR